VREGGKNGEEGHVPVRDRVIVCCHDIPQLKAAVSRSGDKLILIHFAPGAIVEPFLSQEISVFS